MKNLLYIVTLLLFSCGTIPTNKSLVSNFGYTQGTTYNIRYMSPNGEDLKNDINRVLQQVDYSLSTYKTESTISKINRNESTKTDSLFVRVFEAAVRIAEETNGSFDPTIAPIVNYWGFGFEQPQNTDKELHANLMKTVGYEKLQLKENLLFKTNPNTQLDFNAIAQGFTVDLIGEELQKKGINDYMIEVGGELKCKGYNVDNKLWRIGIDKPTENLQENRFQAIIEVHDMAVASSGNYRKFKVDDQDGSKYAHTIHPKTGKPIQTDLLSVTILSKSCMEADAYATACMVMGVEKSLKFLKKHTDLDALLIYTGPQGQWLNYQTEGFATISIYQER
jgi:thiamine biosynthesis lipoprotein